MSNDNATNGAKPQLTRIPLDRVWFVAGQEQDLPGGNAIQPSVIFGEAKVEGRQFSLGYFIPSYQVVEIEWYQKKGSEPEVLHVPMSSVKQMRRSSGKR